MPSKPPIQWIGTENFTPGRCGPGQPVAIVLHEYDQAFESLDAQAKHCIVPAPVNSQNARVHSSFHYGVNDCQIHQYVADSDTAWSFANGGATGWSLPSIYPGVAPDCYTINIAVVTGVLGLNGNCEPKPNNYSPLQLQCLAKLICALAVQHNIAPDATHVWRHGGELADLPFVELMTAINACINAPEDLSGIDDLCDEISQMPLGTVENDTLLVGADCHLYKASDLGGGSNVTVTQSGNTLTITVNGTPYAYTPSIPVDVSVSSAVYNDATNVLTITLSNGVSFAVNLSDLQDIFPTYNPVDCGGKAIDLTDAPALATCADLDSAITTAVNNTLAALNPSDCAGSAIDLTQAPELATCKDLSIAIATAITTAVNNATSVVLAALNPVDCIGSAIDLTKAPALALCSDLHPALKVTFDCAPNSFDAPTQVLNIDSRDRDTWDSRDISGDGTLNPTTDHRVRMLDKGTLLLAKPDACDPKIFYVTNVDPNNPVTVDGNGSPIGGVATVLLQGTGPYSASQGETLCIGWNGSGWDIL